MPDRHDGRRRESLEQSLIDESFHVFVHGRRRFVEEEPIGLGEKRAGDCEPLLLAAGEALRPDVLDMELSDQIGQLRRRKRVANRRVIVTIGLRRIGHCGAQTADGR